MRPLDQYIKDQLEKHVVELEKLLDCDIMAILSQIGYGLDSRVHDAIENIPNKKEDLAIVLETPGGTVEVVERMVNTIRHYYNEVTFIVPNMAMSAGTIFVMSGDRIIMDYFSCLGPIDPQIEKDGRFVPATSYLLQFERLCKKASEGQLTTAEYALLNKLDLGELHQFEQARNLSNDLLKTWLTTYKFKNWKKTKTRKIKVTKKLKEERASEIAEILNDVERWHSHGRGINMKTLTDVLKLEIDDFASVEGLKTAVSGYFELLRDYMIREEIPSFVHTKEYF